MAPDPGLANLDDDQLADELCRQGAEIAAATARWLRLLAELVIRGVWAEQGATSPGQWLSWAQGIAPGTAREHVRVALALRQLPQIRQRFEEGRLSFSKVRALTRIAHPQIEPLLLDMADAAPAAQLERIVTAARHDGLAEPASARRSVTRRSSTGGDAVLTVQVPGEVGDWIEMILERLVAQLDAEDPPVDDEVDGHDPDATGPVARDPISARRADALVRALEIAADQLTADTSGLDRTTLVVHVAASDLTQDSTQEHRQADRAGDRPPRRRVPVVDGRGRDRAMSVKVLRRLACDAGLVLMATDDEGLPIDVGRRQRQLTVALRRALRLRDGTCRFSGCGASRSLHAHHIRWWSKKGPTDLDNLVLLCRAHHDVVHERGWVIHHDGRGRFAFHPPGGPVQPHARPLPADGVSAETSRRRLRDAGTTPDHRALRPRHWYGERLDLDDTTWILRTHLDRLTQQAAA